MFSSVRVPVFFVVSSRTDGSLFKIEIIIKKKKKLVNLPWGLECLPSAGEETLKEGYVESGMKSLRGTCGEEFKY